MKDIFHFHWKLKLTSGMYGDAAVDCATEGCEWTRYASRLDIAIYKLLGRLKPAPKGLKRFVVFTWDGHGDENGGWGDFNSDWDLLKSAQERAASIKTNPFLPTYVHPVVEIVDTYTREIVR